MADRSKETLEEKRAAAEEANRMNRVDKEGLLENLLRIGTGHSPIYKDAGGREPSGFIDTSADRPDADVEAEHIDFDGLMSSMGYAPPQTQTKVASIQSFGDIDPLFQDIAEFKFSSRNRDDEIAILREAIRQGKLVIIQQRQKEVTNQVVENTKKASKGTEKFFRLKDGGLRVEFSLLGQKYSMSAHGMLQSNDCLCWQVEGDSIQGHVMRLQNGQFHNVSSGFEINVTQGWKS
tara:strand:+ start:439491 stop:440195 length:705 start_codon:yes stop_codon:yes gene_type:complete